MGTFVDRELSSGALLDVESGLHQDMRYNTWEYVQFGTVNRDTMSAWTEGQNFYPKASGYYHISASVGLMPTEWQDGNGCFIAWSEDGNIIRQNGYELGTEFAQFQILTLSLTRYMQVGTVGNIRVRVFRMASSGCRTSGDPVTDWLQIVKVPANSLYR